MNLVKNSHEIGTPEPKQLIHLLQCGAHLGTKKWHPSMRSNLIGARNSVFIISIIQTISNLNRALKVISTMSQQNGHILFVNSNSSYNGLIEHVCLKSGQSYVNDRWIGGTLTNWSVVSREIRTYQKVSDQLDLYSNLLQFSTPRYDKMKQSFQGFRPQCPKPDLIFIVDPNQNQDAVHEAWVLNIPTIAIADSDVDLAKITYPIPGNPNSYEFVYYCLNILLKTIRKTQS